MATLIESLAALITPQIAEQMAKALDVPENQVLPAMQLAGAVMLGAVNKEVASQDNAASQAEPGTGDGAANLLASLNMDTTLHNNVMEILNSGSGYPILDHYFGVGLVRVERWLQDNTGTNIAPFLPIAAPLFMRELQDDVVSQKLDAAGLAALLKKETETYADANPELISEVNAALDLGTDTEERAERQMARFTLEEWSTISKVPPLAGYAVMMAALSGPVGLSQEIDALIEAMEQHGAEAEPDSLVGLVSREFSDPEQINALGANRTNALEMARDASLQALAILNEKALYDETLAYKKFVMDVATHVAQATNDGGVLGIGGTPVSDDEQMTLQFIAAALAYSA